MPPTIHLVRHAQGTHNVAIDGHTHPDPSLTPTGLKQCADLRAQFPHHGRLARLVASPLRRTLRTCLLAFGDENPSLLPVTAIDLLQEASASPCDTGSGPGALVDEFGPEEVDLSRVREGWNEKKTEGSEFEPTIEKLMKRGKNARRALRELMSTEGDGHAAVVTHGGFVHFLVDDWEGIPEGVATGWRNCEYRSYQFVDPTGKDEDAMLMETYESWQRRRKDGKPPTLTEQRQIRSAVQHKLGPLLMLKGYTPEEIL